MQTRLSSLTESCLNTASGFVVSWLVWVYIVVPYWNLPVRAADNLAITGMFTVVSIARTYVWRRLFNRSARRA